MILPPWVMTIAQVSTYTAVVTSLFSIFMQLKHYTKPQDQRLVIRILFLVPLYALSAWLSLQETQHDLVPWKKALNVVLTPLREIYEAFTLYTFFSLLTNLLGGERNIIFITQGRAPLPQPFPVNIFLDKLNISDPYIFLRTKRAILQYVWIKPFISLAIFVCKVTDTYHQGEISWTSGYFWIGLVYNLSVSISLYSLGIFWMCLHSDLEPYRPWPKFMCIKLIIFFSYWQGVLLAIASLLGLIQDGASPVIQDWLMCVEMTFFACLHLWAFPYTEYAFSDSGFARMPIGYALRDCVGCQDLIHDFRTTFWGKSYNYRNFDSIESVIIDHPETESRTRKIMDGLRYGGGGRYKYWIDEAGATGGGAGGSAASGPSVATGGIASGGVASGGIGHGGQTPGFGRGTASGANETMHLNSQGGSIGGNKSHNWSHETTPATSLLAQVADIAEITPEFDQWRDGPVTYGATENLNVHVVEEMSEAEIYQDDDLYFEARAMPFGDFNYPVVTVKESYVQVGRRV